MKFGTLILLFLTFSRFCNAMQITDIEGKIITLTAEQAEAFKQCALYKDYQEHTANESIATLLPAINNHFESNPGVSYTLVKQTQEQAVTNELQKIPNDTYAWNLENCSQSFLRANKIIRLLNFITDSSKTNALFDCEFPEFFDLALYMGAPEHKIGILAQKAYDYIMSLEPEQITPLLKYHKQCAIKYLQYYPTVGDFIEDFKLRFVENINEHHWFKLLRQNNHEIMEQANEINLSAAHLQSLGFIKKIRSLHGIEELKKYINGNLVTYLDLTHQEISDFSLEQLQTIFPNLEILILDKNNITKLSYEQFNNLKKLLRIFLQSKKLQTIEPNCFDGVRPNTYLRLTLKEDATKKIEELQQQRLTILNKKHFIEKMIGFIKKQIPDSISAMSQVALLFSSGLITGFSATKLINANNIFINDLDMPLSKSTAFLFLLGYLGGIQTPLAMINEIDNYLPRISIHNQEILYYSGRLNPSSGEE